MIDLADGWARAGLALALLRMDPIGLGGATIRMRASPLRDAVMRDLAQQLPGIVQIHPTISDPQLLGGVDVAATLRAGAPRRTSGLLTGAPVLLTMAERAQADLAAKLAIAMDDGRLRTLVMLDEGADAAEGAPAPLTDRVAFQISPDGRAPNRWQLALAQHMPTVSSTDDDLDAIVQLAGTMGVDSLRAPLFALRAARANAALNRRNSVAADDIAVAAALVLAHRATQVPETAPEDDAAPPQQDTENSQNEGQSDTLPSADMLVDAVKAMLPPDLLSMLTQGATPRAAGSGAGKKRLSNRRGRPLPPRAGRLDGRARIDLIATLRAAAPWQPLRRQQKPQVPGLIIAGEDIRLKRFAEMSDRVLIFAVDASGSAAMSRLGEAKGAIELLLGEAYAKRDHVALITFRGTEAAPLLQPTRSLVQTKRQLADLPGGGGTPLAAGLRSAFDLGQMSTARGMSPTLVLLTDGRANIALDGSANRPQAALDAQKMARLIRGAALPGLVIDTGKRPATDLRTLASEMDAPYLPLPRADARTVSAAVSHAARRA